MASFNHVVVMGNLGRDPELRYTQTNKAVTNFSLAVNEGSGDGATVLWVNVTCWEKVAETCAQHLKKGSAALVSGRLAMREWTDRDGNTRKDFYVNASVVRFVGPKVSAPAPADSPADEEPAF